jgi:hypothetical protein
MGSWDGELTTEGKAGVDLDEFRDRVRDAFEAQFPQTEREGIWVNTVLDDGLIARVKDAHYHYPYTVDKESGDVVFGAPTMVRRSSRWEAVTDGEPNAVFEVPKIATKAGKRLAGSKIEQLESLRAQLRDSQRLLSSILAWAQYTGETPVWENMSAWIEDLFDDADVTTPAALKAHLTERYTERFGPPMHLSEIKSTGKGIVFGGLMAQWGSPEHRDIQGDYFTPETNFWLDHYKNAPALFHHGLDPKVGRVPLGNRDDAKKTTDGLWVQDWINKSNRYFDIVRQLLDAGKLWYSPGSVPHLVDRTPERKITSYPVVDDTGTPIPAQFALGLEDRPLGLVKMAYKAAGLEFTVPEELRGRSPTNGDLTSDEDDEYLAAQARLRLTKARMLFGG